MATPVRPLTPRESGLARVTSRLNVGLEHLVPDAFVFAILLTIVVFVMGIGIQRQTPVQMIQYWAEGFWNFLAFSMQMVLMVVTGHTLATSPSGRRFVERLARIPTNSASAAAFIALVSALLAWISWGLGLIGGGLLALAISRHLRRVNFKLLVAAAYAGMMVGTNGLSVTEPLMVNTPGHFLEKEIGLIPLSRTVLSPQMLVPVLLGTVAVVLLAWLMHGNETPEPVVLADSGSDTAEPTVDTNPTFAGRLDRSRVLAWIVGLAGLLYAVLWFSRKGFDLNLNVFIFILLMLGIVLHGSPVAYVRAVERAVGATHGIILQFPFYAGIQGMMASSGLITTMAGWFTGIASAATYPALTYLSSFVINFFVPSSGGIWLVQGPVMVKAGAALGVSHPTTINAFTAGEVIGNMIQPFWAIPMLGLAGLKMKDIMGYMIVFCAVVSLIFLVSLSVL